VFNRRNVALNDVALERLALTPHDRVLEVGFGGGYLLGRMSHIVTDGLVAGVDRSEGMVAFCQKRFQSLLREGKLEIRCASAEALPYPTGFFTKACTVNTIFYLPDAARAVSELYRVLADDAGVVICFTCKESLKDRGFARHGLVLYEAEDVRALMSSAGFREISMTQSADRWRKFICAAGRK